jgi:hypothetical protein
MQRLAYLAAVALLVASCSLLSTTLRVTAPEGVHPGAPVEPGARPDDAVCAARMRADIAGAVAVRAVLAGADWGLPVATGEGAARQAAADPRSDISTLGIPLTADELAAVLASGIALEPRDALSARLSADPEHYADLWIAAGIVVPVTSAEAATAVRCFEPPGGQVRYVEAGWSKATYDALRSRIDADWQSGALAAAGITVTHTGQAVKDDTWVIEIGVKGLTPAIDAELRRRYGDPVLPVEGDFVQPA